jgi:flagellar hook protein FlgE
MSQAKNAIEAYNTALEASSANIANMSVPGYKRVEVSFQSVFEKVLSRGYAAEGGTGGTNPRQFGQGMSISETSVDFSAGETSTGTSLDLSISGQGLFIVSADGGSSFLYTRNGNFSIDANGNLLSNGLQVYGLDSSGGLVPISGLPSGDKSAYTWNVGNGALNFQGTSTGFRIALTYFSNPSGLAQARGTAFAATLASGDAAAAQAPGGAVGTINASSVEQSNVYYLGETIAALEIQRAMSSNLSVIKMASDLISSFIQKLG